jgi:uncharacterized repeat protein (TIGR03803 family)
MYTSAALAAGSKEKVVYSFAGSPGGSTPEAGVIFDLAGHNLYGTTASGGANLTCGSGCGTIFTLKRGANGTWTENVLHSFDLVHGAYPAVDLILDKIGNLYGTTDVSKGLGMAFELARRSNGWRFDVIHQFNAVSGGNQPRASLVMDSLGNLFGTTVGGQGAVFELTPDSNGHWTDTLIHKFTPAKGDGASPMAGLILDATANLYGTTTYGGNKACVAGCGIVFRLVPQSDGTWKEEVLHEFTGGDGMHSVSGLLADNNGKLYGSAEQGGNGGCFAGCGTLFQLTPQSGGGWKFTLLHVFKQTDGGSPQGAMALDTAGNLYGTTVIGGNLAACPQQGGCGVVFKLAPAAGGKRKYSVLYKFNNVPDGALPKGLVMDKAGNMYGTTITGGNNGLGVVFEVTP